MLTNRAAERLAEIRMRQPWQCVSSQTKLDEAVMVTSGTTVRPPFSFQQFCQVRTCLCRSLRSSTSRCHGPSPHRRRQPPRLFRRGQPAGFKDNPNKYDSPEQRQALRDRAIITPTGFATEITARTWRELMVAAHTVNQKAEAAYEGWRVPYRKRVLIDGEIATISNRLWDA